MTERTIRQLPVDTGISGWLALSERRSPARILEERRTADYLIIGAGFAGLSAARRLSQTQPGESIAILDAKKVAESTSGRNSGFMIDLPHNLISGEYSPNDTAETAAEIDDNRFAIGFAASAAQDYGMAPNVFDPCGKTNAAATARGEKLNANFARSLARIGEPYETFDAKVMREMTGSNYYTSGLHTPGTVMIQPADYIHAFAAAVGRVADVYEDSPALALGRNAGLWTARTPKGAISSPKVILAVNGLVQAFGHFSGCLMHVFTYASMTKAMRSGTNGFGRTGQNAWAVLPADPMGATVRKVSPNGNERVIIRTRFTYDPQLRVSEARVTKIAAEQLKSFEARFPHLKGLGMEFSWAGALCLSRNHVPAFGEIEENLFSACCENGVGTVKSTLAGVLAADLAAGRGSDRLRRFLSFPKPEALPPEPFAWLGINSVIRWQELRAGREG
jgi:glycine/D-amino acid oxidase-like deaminating enzyme